MNETNMDSTKRCCAYFDVFLPGILNVLLLEELESLSTCFEIYVSNCGRPAWRLRIEQGRLCDVGHEGPAPVCRYTLDADALLDVASARSTPQEAFFSQRIELDGDMEMGMRLSTVLEPFFRRYPFQ